MRRRHARESVDAYDVIVVGGGNAGLCAALSAVDCGRRVLLVERAPIEYRGGNSRHTRDIRCCQRLDGDSMEVYDDHEFLDDVMKVTGGTTNRNLAQKVVADSWGIPAWMESQGIKWQKALKGTLHLSRTNRFFLGGGKALVNAYYETARRKGVTVMYNTAVEDLLLDGSRFVGMTVTSNGSPLEVKGSAVVVASGGLEANLGWLRSHWGPAAENFIIRGTRYNDGKLTQSLIRMGVRATGDPRQFHAIAVDARGPRFDGGILTRIDSLPFGIVVNSLGRRFYDEGEDLWPKRYAIWGRLIAEQPGQIAYSVLDSKVTGAFMPTLYRPHTSDTLDGLAELMETDRTAFLNTVAEYNSHLLNGPKFDPSGLDSNRTEGLNPPKSHWALPIDKPPFYAYPLRPGITFTYAGVEVDSTSRMIGSDGRPLDNAFAAGEVMAGNILTRGYLAGFGLTIGTVFGRTAGEEASRVV